MPQNKKLTTFSDFIVNTYICDNVIPNYVILCIRKKIRHTLYTFLYFCTTYLWLNRRVVKYK